MISGDQVHVPVTKAVTPPHSVSRIMPIDGVSSTLLPDDNHDGDDGPVMTEPPQKMATKAEPSASALNPESASATHLTFAQALQTVHEPDVRADAESTSHAS